MTRERQLLDWALYVSEGWYAQWESRDLLRRTTRSTFPIYAKTRALVLFDRVLNERFA